MDKRKAPYNKGKPKAPPKPKKQDDSLSFANTPLLSSPELASHHNLHKLDLTNCSLSSIGFVKEAKNLTWLNVSGNDLSAKRAWDGVEELNGLFVLNASSCSLTSVPPVVASLITLKALVLTHNSLRTLAHLTASHTALNTIVVSHNALLSLPDSLSSLSALTKLSAAHNQLTPALLPDLSTLPRLREIRLNDNPLKTLPDHFATWAKLGAGAKGLEIVELGNCAFDDWGALRFLAGQSAIVNLGLKGNPVVVDAVEEEGFDAFKAKMTILLPALRILDANRFDAKFADLKAKRDARPVEQKILDAGPMALAANLKAENPIKLKALEKSRGKKRRRDKPASASEDEGEGDTVAVSKEGPSGVAGATEEEEAAPKKRKKKTGSTNSIPGEEETALSALSAATSSLASTSSSTLPLSAAVIDNDEAQAKQAKKEKRKNRHAARREAETGDSARPHVDPSTNPAPSTSSDIGTAEKEKEKPRKKRGRESKFLGTTRTEEERKKGVDALPLVKKKEKRKRVEGGLLDALKGDGTEERRKPSPAAPVPVEVQPEVPTAGEKEKVKTSVLKVEVVKKDKKQEAEPVDVLDLFGKASTVDTLGALAGWD